MILNIKKMNRYLKSMELIDLSTACKLTRESKRQILHWIQKKKVQTYRGVNQGKKTVWIVKNSLLMLYKNRMIKLLKQNNHPKTAINPEVIRLDNKINQLEMFQSGNQPLLADQIAEQAQVYERERDAIGIVLVISGIILVMAALQIWTSGIL